ncbi:MAG: DHHA1 domain-containing protein [Nitrososphaeria archaeon]|nr:DHHA1 domain-containing protein [Nitrososphaeria archaeon]
MYIITHGDCDGICAGALALSVFPESKVVLSNPIRLYDSLKKVYPDETVIICDIAINEILFEKMGYLLNNFKHVTYIDHHPLSSKIVSQFGPNIELVHELECSTSELTFYKFQELIDPEFSRIAVYGAIGDYLDNTKGVENIILNWDKRTLYFQTGILIQALEAIGKNDNKKLEILEKLSKNVPPSEINSLIELAIEATQNEEEMRKYVKANVLKVGEIGCVLNPNGPLGKAAIYAKAYACASVGLAGEIKHGKVEMSLRTHFSIDLNSILLQIVSKFDGVGGGHAKAAGAEVPYERFQDFLNELNAKVSVNLPK